MKVSEFVSKAKYIADNLATTYALGTWGWAGMDKMKTRAINKNQTNKNLANKIKALPASGFMFDCGGIIKGIIWGFSANPNKIYGGAGYACNGLPDTGNLIAYCHDVSTDFNHIKTGEIVYMPGHVGICVDGETGLVVEATTKWESKVLYSYIYEKNPNAKKARKWDKHGMLNCLEDDIKVCPTCGRPL